MPEVAAATLILICEGRCNPHLRDFDEAAARFTGEYTMLGDGEWMLFRDMARILVHTPHESDGTYRWKLRGWYRTFRCTVCGAYRAF